MANFETVKLDKGLYTTGKGFCAELESIDSSDNYKGTALEGLDAYERQLKRFDIKISGGASDTVDKFFATTDSAALFPEYVARAVRKGLESADLLPQIIATKTNINGLDYRTITSIPTDDDKSLKLTAEGAIIPETNVKTQENLVKLKKRGRMLVASYEAIKFQRLDLFTVTLKQIGAYIARTQLKDAVDVLINGDGNLNPAISSNVATAGKIWNGFDPYELNTIIAAPDVTAKILQLPEMRDAAAGLSFHANGKQITPLGAALLKCGSVANGKLIGIDKSCTLEMVEAGGIMTEYDKLIDRQLERAAITQISGFAKI
ncbi:MAG: phage major capsid protein, partial [Oscillospiraceae bacterium]